MNTVTLKRNTDTAVYKENKKTLRKRIVDYFEENWGVMTLGMYSLSGRMPDIEFLRSMNLM